MSRRCNILPCKYTRARKANGLRLLHLADLHLGKQVNNFPLLEDQRFMLQGVLDMAAQHEVDALLLAGDLYDKSSPSASAVQLFDWFLTELTRLNIPCLGIPGNHDSAERIAYAQGLLSEQGVYFPPVFGGQVSCVQLQDEHGPVNVWLLPYLRPIDVRRAFPQQAEEINTSYTAALGVVLDACNIDTSQRNVLVAHQFVTAGGTQPQRAADEFNLGGIDNVDASVFDGFDYVALGHVHRAQRIGRDTVRYAGSLLKYSMSEARYAKSAVLVELGAKAVGEEADSCVSFELLDLEPLRDLREIKGPLEALLSEEVASSGNKEDYLHVTLTDEAPHIDALARLRAVYPNVMALDYERTLSRAQEPLQPAADIEEANPAELLADFFEAQTGRALSAEQELAATAFLKQAAEDEGGDAR